MKKGDLLVKLDTQQEEAQLRSAEAKLDLAKTDLERKRDLIAKKAIAQSDWTPRKASSRRCSPRWRR